MHDMSHNEFVMYVEARIDDADGLGDAEHDALMAELSRRAQDHMPPLAFHAWLGTSFGLSTGLVTEAELDTMGPDVYWVLFELEGRGVLEELDRAMAAGTLQI
jgi:hypothetical protein